VFLYFSSQAQESSTASSSNAYKKKTKYVSLYTKEGQDRLAVLIPGRHACECLGQKHKLINNCLVCGRIVCEQEGSGPCLFCGSLVSNEVFFFICHSYIESCFAWGFKCAELASCLGSKLPKRSAPRAVQERTCGICCQGKNSCGFKSLLHFYEESREVSLVICIALELT